MHRFCVPFEVLYPTLHVPSPCTESNRCEQLFQTRVLCFPNVQLHFTIIYRSIIVVCQRLTASSPLAAMLQPRLWPDEVQFGLVTYIYFVTAERPPAIHIPAPRPLAPLARRMVDKYTVVKYSNSCVQLAHRLPHSFLEIF